MRRFIRGIHTIPVCFVVMAVFALTSVVELSSADIPCKLLSGFKSEDFKVRESAQADLLAWAREIPKTAMDALFEESRQQDDPEVAERCIAVLRELVFDQYHTEGEGYVGILMQDAKTLMPDQKQQLNVIRVIQVVPDSPAEKSGMRLNDLITALNGEEWRAEAALKPFSLRIREFKPGHTVVLRVLREGESLDLKVRLGRRPPIDENPFFGLQNVDPQSAERAAKEAYFQRWLERRKKQPEPHP